MKEREAVKVEGSNTVGQPFKATDGAGRVETSVRGDLSHTHTHTHT